MLGGMKVEYAVVVFNEESRVREGVVVGRHHNGKVVVVNRLAERGVKMGDIWFGQMVTTDDLRYWIFTPIAKLGRLNVDSVEAVEIPEQRHVVFDDNNCPEVDGVVRFEWVDNVGAIINGGC